VGIHQPEFEVKNLRENTYPQTLGTLANGVPVENRANFPAGNVQEPCADRIYEIANPFPFRGTTFINSAWADHHAGQPETITLPRPAPCSLFQSLDQWQPNLTPEEKTKFLELLPHPICIALAQASTDPNELMLLAQKACTLLFEKGSSSPWGIGYTQTKEGRIVPDIHDPEVFEVLVNNPFLPDAYKKTMVLKPGVQGNSEIVGEYTTGDKSTHVFEYLRRNSYIPWGHYASNMADDAIRYRAKALTLADMTGLRHLYYQRVYVRMADQLGIDLNNLNPDFTPDLKKSLSTDELETIRIVLIQALKSVPQPALAFNRSLWGWNFGFGFAQSGHRLHASHQMIHQQNSMVPEKITDNRGEPYDCFACGDLITRFITDFKRTTGKGFFKAYLSAIQNNERTDGNPAGPASLIVHEDPRVILFVPKAQTSEWELTLMTKTPCSNILEADTALRASLDHAMLVAIQTLETLGAQMVTAVELSGRFDRQGLGQDPNQDVEQHLLYSFIPKLPYAPGTFSEAQLRWISGCYPEDFAQACRKTARTPKMRHQRRHHDSS
jgi:hypothetical protein